jgi:protein involved in polysaccharide export with SLBB domain
MKQLLLLISLALYACALPSSVIADDEFTPNPLTPLSKGDAMLIRIENVGGGIPKYREIVDSDGNIKLPFLGLMSAVGKTKADLATEIAEAYLTARLSTNTAVQLRIVNHFEPPPDRDTLVRTQDPRRPVSIPAHAPLPP